MSYNLWIQIKICTNKIFRENIGKLLNQQNPKNPKNSQNKQPLFKTRGLHQSKLGHYAKTGSSSAENDYTINAELSYFKRGTPKWPRLNNGGTPRPLLERNAQATLEGHYDIVHRVWENATTSRWIICSLSTATGTEGLYDVGDKTMQRSHLRTANWLSLSSSAHSKIPE